MSFLSMTLIIKLKAFQRKNKEPKLRQQLCGYIPGLLFLEEKKMSETSVINSELKADEIQSLIEKLQCREMPAPDRMSIFASLEERIGAIEDFDGLCGPVEGRLESLRTSIVRRDIKKLINRGLKKVRLTYTDGTREVKRVFISKLGAVCEYGKHCRRYGHEFAPSQLRRISKVEPVLNKSDFQTHAERYADKVRKWRNYILKNLHPNLWSELRRQAESVTDEMIVSFGRLGFKSHYDAWKSAPDNGLPQIGDYKTITLASCRIPSHLPALIASAINYKKEFSHVWRDSYNYSVGATIGENGIYRACFSAEFKDCGNGHYYLLLNNNNAIFSEHD